MFVNEFEFPALITYTPNLVSVLFQEKIKVDDEVVILKLILFSCFEVGEVVRVLR